MLTPMTVAVRSWDALARDAIERASTGHTWSVHSVFTSAFNLLTDDGRLVGMVSEPAGNGPSTLVLARRLGATPFTSMLAPGDSVQVVDVRVVVAGRLELGVSAARLWSPKPIRRTVTARTLWSRLDRVTQIAAGLPDRGGFSPLLGEALALTGGPPGDSDDIGTSIVVRRARALLAGIVAAIRLQRWNDVSAHVRGLSGLGPGLTPAGDDALVGLVLGLRAALGELPIEVERAISDAIVGRTTDLAEARVRHALAGRADEVVHRLLSVMVSGHGDGLTEAVTDVLAYGHSSGADTLVGMLLGLGLGIRAEA